LFHPVINAGPFFKLAIDFVECNPPSFGDHNYIIVAIGYFMKWVEAMPMFKNTATIATRFFFNHAIFLFNVPKQLIYDHGKHFEYQIWDCSHVGFLASIFVLLLSIGE
jgi:hypothetical protein